MRVASAPGETEEMQYIYAFVAAVGAYALLYSLDQPRNAGIAAGFLVFMVIAAIDEVVNGGE